MIAKAEGVYGHGLCVKRSVAKLQLNASASSLRTSRLNGAAICTVASQPQCVHNQQDATLAAVLLQIHFVNCLESSGPSFWLAPVRLKLPMQAVAGAKGFSKGTALVALAQAAAKISGSSLACQDGCGGMRSWYGALSLAGMQYQKSLLDASASSLRTSRLSAAAAIWTVAAQQPQRVHNQQVATFSKLAAVLLKIDLVNWPETSGAQAAAKISGACQDGCGGMRSCYGALSLAGMQYQKSLLDASASSLRTSRLSAAAAIWTVASQQPQRVHNQQVATFSKLAAVLLKIHFVNWLESSGPSDWLAPVRLKLPMQSVAGAKGSSKGTALVALAQAAAKISGSSLACQDGCGGMRSCYGALSLAGMQYQKSLLDASASSLRTSRLSAAAAICTVASQQPQRVHNQQVATFGKLTAVLLKIHVVHWQGSSGPSFWLAPVRLKLPMQSVAGALCSSKGTALVALAQAAAKISGSSLACQDGCGGMRSCYGALSLAGMQYQKSLLDASASSLRTSRLNAAAAICTVASQQPQRVHNQQVATFSKVAAVLLKIDLVNWPETSGPSNWLAPVTLKLPMQSVAGAKGSSKGTALVALAQAAAKISGPSLACQDGCGGMRSCYGALSLAGMQCQKSLLDASASSLRTSRLSAAAAICTVASQQPQRVHNQQVATFSKLAAVLLKIHFVNWLELCGPSVWLVAVRLKLPMQSVAGKGSSKGTALVALAQAAAKISGSSLDCQDCSADASLAVGTLVRAVGEAELEFEVRTVRKQNIMTAIFTDASLKKQYVAALRKPTAAYVSKIGADKNKLELLAPLRFDGGWIGLQRLASRSGITPALLDKLFSRGILSKGSSFRYCGVAAMQRCRFKIASRTPAIAAVCVGNWCAAAPLRTAARRLKSSFCDDLVKQQLVQGSFASNRTCSWAQQAYPFLEISSLLPVQKLAESLCSLARWQCQKSLLDASASSLRTSRLSAAAAICTVASQQPQRVHNQQVATFSKLAAVLLKIHFVNWLELCGPSVWLVAVRLKLPMQSVAGKGSSKGTALVALAQAAAKISGSSLDCQDCSADASLAVGTLVRAVGEAELEFEVRTVRKQNIMTAIFTDASLKKKYVAALRKPTAAYVSKIGADKNKLELLVPLRFDGGWIGLQGRMHSALENQVLGSPLATRPREFIVQPAYMVFPGCI